MGNRGRRHRNHYQNYRRNQRRFQARKGGGWGMNLYRNTREGKIAGVCAGLADHWDIAHWVVRLLWVGAFIFTGTLALWAYIGAWILLAPRPIRRDEDSFSAADVEDYEEAEIEMEYDERYHDYRPRKVFRYSEASSVRLKRARDRLDAALRRVEDMETYVTSRQYNLNKEFSKL
ncbi:MAG: PspC domain-containing protein [Halieaceae bacterium]|nr:PspC domain-containing protein [Halieaceae bacterium]